MSVAARVRRPRAPPFLDPPGYARHRPEATLLYQLVEQHYPAFLELRAEAGRPLPEHVQEEFEAYLSGWRRWFRRRTEEVARRSSQWLIRPDRRHRSIEDPWVTGKILSHLERADPQSHRSELPLGARAPPVRARTPVREGKGRIAGGGAGRTGDSDAGRRGLTIRPVPRIDSAGKMG